MSESPHPIEGAFAVCQHPYGEGVWWHLKDGDDGSECIQECGCTPLVAVPLARLQEVEGEAARLKDEADSWSCNAKEWMGDFEAATTRAESAETRLREARKLLRTSAECESNPSAALALREAADGLATDPNSTEPMASGAAGENSQGTSDSEDKAVLRRLQEVEEALEELTEAVADDLAAHAGEMELRAALDRARAALATEGDDG